MLIHVLYWAGSRADAGCAEEMLEVPEAATVADAAVCIARKHPRLRPHLKQVRWARNLQFVDDTEPLQHNDELALIPPVCGGTPRASLQREPLDVEAVRRRVAAGGIGATVIFVGTVRNHSGNHDVTRLTYEAYVPMAEQQLERVAAACSQQGAEVYIAHRHGHLEVGEVSVVIAAAAPHRDAAFVACRQALERIKTDVPIWKCESSSSGERWVGWGGG